MKKAILFLSLALLTLTALVLLTARPSPAPRTLSQADFLAALQSNLLTEVRVYYPAKPVQVEGVSVMLNDVRGTLTDPARQQSKANGTPADSVFLARVHLTPELEAKLLARPNIAVIEPNPFVQKARDWLAHSK